MNDIGTSSSTETNEAIGRRAADFLLRRRFWQWSDADQAELDAWLAESDFHQVAWLRQEGGVAEIERLAALRPFNSEPEQEARTSWRFAWPLLAAASLALITVTTIVLLRAPVESPVRTLATAVGGRAVLKFTDGTEFELNTNTAIRYRMTARQRIVWLDRGEAWFRVAHNAANPFVVLAAGHHITDLGTEFLVRDDAGAVDVTLVKGRAQLRAENPDSGSALLVPGDEAVATQISMTVTKRTPEELADALAWQRGVLVFRRTKLEDAVREFNRYNRTKLLVDDPEVAQMAIGGEFRIDNLGEFLRTMQVVLKLRIEREGDDILLAPSSGKATRGGSARAL